MKHSILITIVICLVSVSGCSGDTPKELFETAKLEELQNNPDHARKLYQEIIKDHPESKYAKDAKKRLMILPKK
ncbi:MAG: hypothetical protein B6245_06635 [Desulfobacteraceae bacterium 4572_88]|nr:MAG: hypothetical protein B6245_06635 [Desulfobacteraceae bacterium 4572_88]